MELRRVTTVLCLLFLSVIICGQTISPSWIEDEFRSLNYPTDQWYTGFVRDKLSNNVNVANALKTLERDAQNQLAESIILRIEGGSLLENISRQQQQGDKDAEIINTNYLQVVKTATMATTVKTDVRSYHNTSTNMLYAFAAVRRSDLLNFYLKRINLDLNKVEIALQASEKLVLAGKKISARRKCIEAKKILDDTTAYFDLLIAVTEDTDENLMQIEQNHYLHNSIEQLLIDLEQSTFVYVDCKYETKGLPHDAFSSDPGILCDIIMQALNENECSVTDNQEEADYELILITSTTQRSTKSERQGLISYYANVWGNLYNRLTRKRIIDFSIVNDSEAYATGKDAEQAAIRAFKLPALSEKILGKVLPKLKN